MTSIALTGFANFSSIGICMEGIAALCPERSADVSKIVFKVMFASTCVLLIGFICWTIHLIIEDIKTNPVYGKGGVSMFSNFNPGGFIISIVVIFILLALMFVIFGKKR